MIDLDSVLAIIFLFVVMPGLLIAIGLLES